MLFVFTWLMAPLICIWILKKIFKSYTYERHAVLLNNNNNNIAMHSMHIFKSDLIILKTSAHSFVYLNLLY